MPSFESISTPEIPKSQPSVADQVRKRLEAKRGGAISYLHFPGEENKMIRCPHPEIVSAPRTTSYREEDSVNVQLADNSRPVKISFTTYLQTLGSSYPAYYRTFKTEEERRGSVDHSSLFRTLHQGVIDQRTTTALSLKREYERHDARKTNYQEVTTKEDGQFFVHTVNDLNIDGLRAESATTREDFLDGIDEFVIVNPTELAGEEEKQQGQGDLYIGIQRSFEDKRDIVRHDHWRTIPERSNLLQIPRIGVKESFSEYGRNENGQGTSYWQRLLSLRAQEAKSKGKDTRDLAVPPVYRVLGTTKIEGQKESMNRALKLLETIQAELALYASDQRATPGEQERLAVYQSALESARQQVEEDLASFE